MLAQGELTGFATFLYVTLQLEITMIRRVYSL